MKISVLIGCKTRLFAEGIGKLLEADSWISTYEIALNSSDFIRKLGNRPDVAIADSKILEDIIIPPPTRLLLIHDRNSCSMGYAKLHEMIDRGLAGFLTPKTDAKMLFKAVHTVATGHLWLDRKTIDTVLTKPDEKPSQVNLTEKEGEVLLYLRKGFSNREIAGKLFVSEQTVKSHCNRIFRKFGVKSRLKLISTLTTGDRKQSSWSVN